MGHPPRWPVVAAVALTWTLHGVASAERGKDDATLYKRFLPSRRLRRLGFNVDDATKEMVLALKAKLCPDCELALTRRSVDEMRTLDINRDGRKDLVALTSDGCTADPNGVLLVCSVPRGYIVQMIFTERALLEDTLRDVDGDGKYEIVTNSWVMGATCHAMACHWHDVYTWTPRGYTPANCQYLEPYYLAQYLPELIRYIAFAEERLQLGDDRSDATAILQDARMLIGKVVALAKQGKE